MWVSLSLDDITVQFPPDKLSASFQSLCESFYDNNPVVAAASECVLWKHNVFNKKH